MKATTSELIRAAFTHRQVIITAGVITRRNISIVAVHTLKHTSAVIDMPLPPPSLQGHVDAEIKPGGTKRRKM